MWGGSMVIDAVWVRLAVLAWLRSERRLAARIDLQTLAELPAAAGPAVTRPPRRRPADDDRGTAPASAGSPAALRLHAALAAGLALSGARPGSSGPGRTDGHAVAWVYTFEWPLFAVLGRYLWWRLLHAGRPRPASARRRRPADRRRRTAGRRSWSPGRTTWPAARGRPPGRRRRRP